MLDAGYWILDAGYWMMELARPGGFVVRIGERD
jgi:hypothetical protein